MNALNWKWTSRWLLAGVLLVSTPVGGEEAPQEPRLSLEVAETRDQHLLLAAEYRRRSAQLHFDANMHRGMKQSYSQALTARRPSASLRRWWAKQRPHCDRLIQEAERLAVEMDGFSAFHTQQATEMDDE